MSLGACVWHACVYVRACICVCACEHISLHALVCVQICLDLFVQMCVCLSLSLSEFACVCMGACQRVHAHVRLSSLRHGGCESCNTCVCSAERTWPGASWRGAL